MGEGREGEEAEGRKAVPPEPAHTHRLPCNMISLYKHTVRVAFVIRFPI